MIYIIIIAVVLIVIYTYFKKKPVPDPNANIKAFLTNFYTNKIAPSTMTDVRNKYLAQYQWIQSQKGYFANPATPTTCTPSDIVQSTNLLYGQIACDAITIISVNINIAIMLTLTMASFLVDIKFLAVSSTTKWIPMIIYDPITSTIQDNLGIFNKSGPITIDDVITFFNTSTGFVPNSSCDTCTSVMSLISSMSIK